MSSVEPSLTRTVSGGGKVLTPRFRTRSESVLSICVSVLLALVTAWFAYDQVVEFKDAQDSPVQVQEFRYRSHNDVPRVGQCLFTDDPSSTLFFSVRMGVSRVDPGRVHVRVIHSPSLPLVAQLNMTGNMTHARAVVLRALRAAPSLISWLVALEAVPLSDWSSDVQDPSGDHQLVLYPRDLVCARATFSDTSIAWGRRDAMGGRFVAISFVGLSRSRPTDTVLGVDPPLLQTKMFDPRVAENTIRSLVHAMNVSAIVFKQTVLPDRLEYDPSVSTVTATAADVTNTSELASALGLNATLYDVFATATIFAPALNVTAVLKDADTVSLLQLVADMGGIISIGVAVWSLLFPLSSTFKRRARKCCGSDDTSGGQLSPSASETSPTGGGAARTFTVHSVNAAPQRSVTLFTARYSHRRDMVLVLLFVTCVTVGIGIATLRNIERLNEQRSLPPSRFSWEELSSAGLPVPSLLLCAQAAASISFGAVYLAAGNRQLSVDWAIADIGLKAPGPVDEVATVTQFSAAQLASFNRETLVSIRGNSSYVDYLASIVAARVPPLQPPPIVTIKDTTLTSDLDVRHCAIVNGDGRYGAYVGDGFIQGYVVVVATARPLNASGEIGFNIDVPSYRLTALSQDTFGSDIDAEGVAAIASAYNYILVPEEGSSVVTYRPTKDVALDGTETVRYSASTNSLLSSISDFAATGLKNMLGVSESKTNQSFAISLLQVSPASDYYLQTSQVITYDWGNLVADLGGMIAFASAAFVLAMPLKRMPRREARILRVLSCGRYRPVETATTSPNELASRGGAWRVRFPYGVDAWAAGVVLALLLGLACVQIYELVDEFRNEEPTVTSELVARKNGNPTPAVRFCVERVPGMRWSLTVFGRKSHVDRPACVRHRHRRGRGCHHGRERARVGRVERARNRRREVRRRPPDRTRLVGAGRALERVRPPLRHDAGQRAGHVSNSEPRQ